MAVLYRTNAQSRAIEDALMREGMPYKIIGGVRFYERKEIKDALAYLKLIINPHDDVSLRRVINVPARGIGKGVMDSLRPSIRRRAADAAAARRRLGSRRSSARSLWAKMLVRSTRAAAGRRGPPPRCACSATSSPGSPRPRATTRSRS
jgi:DNA helicase II / ATP-dependent DNA helicase PcrA